MALVDAALTAIAEAVPAIAAVVIVVVVMLAFGWKVGKSFMDTLASINEDCHEHAKKREEAMMRHSEAAEKRLVSVLEEAHSDREKMVTALQENTRRLGELDSTMRTIGGAR